MNGGPAPVLLMVRTLDFGGSERQCAVTAMALEASRFRPFIGVFHREGFRVREVEAAGVPIIRFPVRSFRSPSTLRVAAGMTRFIRQHGVRLVHTFDVPMNVFGVPVARAARSRPVVLSSARAHRTLTPGMMHRMLRFTDRLVDGIVVNCEAMREHLVRDEGVPAEKTRLCYNGIDTSIFHARRPANGPELVVGAICGLRVEKGLDTLVEGFARAAAGQPGVRLLIVGSGVCLPDLQRQAAQLGIIAQTSFLPAQPAVADLLRTIDIFVLPSRSEALSNSLMEAMACGCSAVASTVGGNPELVHDGRTGLLFPAGDDAALAGCLSRLIDNPELRLNLAAAGARRIATQFSQQSSAARMAEIYAEYLDRGAST